MNEIYKALFFFFRVGAILKLCFRKWKLMERRAKKIVRENGIERFEVMSGKLHFRTFLCIEEIKAGEAPHHKIWTKSMPESLGLP